MKKLIFCILSGILVGAGVGVAKEFRYEPDWDSIRSRYEVPEWFRDAKFGIFLHWGPYAVTEIDCKYATCIYNQKRHGGLCWDYHREHFGDPADGIGYKDIIPLFKAERFDATEWIRLFKRAGARYVVPVAEHHDGYAMYASRHTRWNVVETGPKKDTMRLLAEAARNEGLKFGCSSHFALTHIYYPRDNPKWDTNDPEYADLYWKADQLEGGKPSPEFIDYWWRRTTDIIDQYQPDIMWFDYGLDKPGWEVVHKKILAYYYNKGLEWGKEVVFQDKNMNRAKRVDGVFVW
ncbi:MAG: alpha-L-fucosidase, partial [Verrucomicrobia bacterium]